MRIVGDASCNLALEAHVLVVYGRARCHARAGYSVAGRGSSYTILILDNDTHVEHVESGIRSRRHTLSRRMELSPQSLPLPAYRFRSDLARGRDA